MRMLCRTQLYWMDGCIVSDKYMHDNEDNVDNDNQGDNQCCLGTITVIES